MVEMSQIVTAIGTLASLLCTIIMGILSFFIKKTLTSFEEADKNNAARIEKMEEKLKEADRNNAAQIEKVEDKLNDLKADLPLLYVTREDFIRIMNRVEDKLDQLLYGSGGSSKGKEV